MQTVSHNPQPDPGQDMTLSYFWRFRDPNFIAIWQRWMRARDGWRRAELRTAIRDGAALCAADGPLAELMTHSPADVRAAAVEFQDARRAYLDELARRTEE